MRGIRCILVAAFLAAVALPSITPAVSAQSFGAAVYFDFTRSILGALSGSFDVELMGQAPVDDHWGLEAKLQWRLKAFNKRLDLAAGAVYYLFEAMQGPYASALIRLSHAEARVDGYELQLFPEVALGWMWSFGSKSAMQVGVGLEASVGWVLFAYESGTFEPWISVWIGGNL